MEQHYKSILRYKRCLETCSGDCIHVFNPSTKWIYGKLKTKFGWNVVVRMMCFIVLIKFFISVNTLKNSVQKTLTAWLNLIFFYKVCTWVIKQKYN